jgi:hypothetical protein
LLTSGWQGIDRVAVGFKTRVQGRVYRC